MLIECCLIFPRLLVIIRMVIATLSGHGSERAAHGSCPAEPTATLRETRVGRGRNNQKSQVCMCSGYSEHLHFHLIENKDSTDTKDSASFRPFKLTVFSLQ